MAPMETLTELTHRALRRLTKLVLTDAKVCQRRRAVLQDRTAVDVIAAALGGCPHLARMLCSCLMRLLMGLY